MTTMNHAPVRTRWTPPSSTVPKSAKVVEVNDAILGKVLAMNPNLSCGKSVGEFKHDLEYGSPASPKENATPKQDTETRLNETVSFFLDGKISEVETRLADFAARKRALAVEEQACIERAQAQVVGFFDLLDRDAVSRYGRMVTSKYRSKLMALGISLEKTF